jgi:hypothetical protein
MILTIGPYTFNISCCQQFALEFHAWETVVSSFKTEPELDFSSSVFNLAIVNDLKLRFDTSRCAAPIDDIHFYEDRGRIWYQDSCSIGVIDITHNVASIEPLIDDFERCINSDLKMILSFLSLRDGGFIFHSSAAKLKEIDKGAVFYGYSGAGKSTIVGLLSGALKIDKSYDQPAWEALNGDCNLILPHEHTFRVYALPFSTKLKRQNVQPLSAKIASAYRLIKSLDCNKDDMSLQQKISSILSSVCMLGINDYWSKKVFENAASFCSTVRVLDLSFSLVKVSELSRLLSE